MKKYNFQWDAVIRKYLIHKVKQTFRMGFSLLILLPYSSPAQDKVLPGAFIVEPPTLENLGFEWYIEGDDNRNATVDVAYRIAG